MAEVRNAETEVRHRPARICLCHSFAFVRHWRTQVALALAHIHPGTLISLGKDEIMSIRLAQIPTLRESYHNAVLKAAKAGTTRFAPKEHLLDRVSLLSVPLA